MNESITLGGGCFWCTEAVFSRVAGVLAVESGYCNGVTLKPSYEQVCSGNTGHNEVVQVTFDPAIVSLETLLKLFFATHDPTTLNRQGNDVGTQYRSGIYAHHEEQLAVANRVKEELDQSNIWGSALVTEIQLRNNYSRAEDYHQRYFELHPNQGYCSVVIAPKVSKLRKQFSHLLRG
jgi:peptide-methionine (S)-S-oxide reductase